MFVFPPDPPPAHPQVKGDVRLIVGQVFATRYSLRFPKPKRIRWSPCWCCCQQLAPYSGNPPRTLLKGASVQARPRQHQQSQAYRRLRLTLLLCHQLKNRYDRDPASATTYEELLQAVHEHRGTLMGE